jgi:hypothetical protein
LGILSAKNGETFNENLLNYSEKYKIKKEKTREKVSQWREKQQDTKSVYCWSNLAYYRKEDSYAIIISDDEIYNDDKVGVLKYTRE